MNLAPPSYWAFLQVASEPPFPISVPHYTAGLGSPAGSRPVGAHDEIHVAVQDMQEGQQLVYCLSVVGLIQEAVELRRRRSQPADDLPFREGARLHPLLGFDGEPIQQRVTQVAGILVVL